MARIDQNLSDVRDEDMNHDGRWRALPEGDYLFMVTESSLKDTKNGRGQVLWLKVQCIEDQHKSSKWTEFLTIRHENADTVRIARAKLLQLALAIGHPTPRFVRDSDELHNIPFIASVKQELASDPKYGDVAGMQNRIAAYKSAKGGTISAPKANGAKRAAVDTGDEPPVESYDADVSW